MLGLGTGSWVVFDPRPPSRKRDEGHVQQGCRSLKSLGANEVPQLRYKIRIASPNPRVPGAGAARVVQFYCMGGRTVLLVPPTVARPAQPPDIHRFTVVVVVRDRLCGSAPLAGGRDQSPLLLCRSDYATGVVPHIPQTTHVD
jgi:hypothetical protein